MPLSDIVSVTISTDSVGVSQAGFGVPLILSHTASWTERVRSYTSLSAVAADFATTTPEYLMATALFAQSVKPTKIKIGRCANKPTQKYSIVPTVANSTVYTVVIGSTSYSYTSDASATNDEITDGLQTLINAGSGDTTTATVPGSSGSHVLTLTANAAGNFDSVYVADTSLLSITQDHADPGLAADLAAIALQDNDWYFILNPFNSKACALIIAAYAEANNKIFIAQTGDSNNATLALGSDSTTSLMGQAKTSAYARTAVIYHPNIKEFADAAWIGKCGPLNPGSETWAFKTLSGVSADNLTATHITNIEAKYGSYYVVIAGVNVTQRSLVSSNEYIDVIRFRDWLKARMQERIFSRLAAMAKIPFTDQGIAVIENEVRAQLQEGVDAGGISTNPAFVVTVPKASAVSSANKTARLLPDVKFTATLAGAIHKTTITGVVSV